jgi:hypothetical protein
MERTPGAFIRGCLPSVAALHLTGWRLHGTFRRNIIPDSGGTLMRDFLSTFKMTFFVAFAAVAGLAALNQPVQAAGVLERGIYLSGPRYDGDMRGCGEALGTIVQQFAEKEGKFWNSNLEITGFAEVHEVAFRAWARDSIPRRFCTASAMLNDGRARQVHYSVIEDGGFAGFDSGVEWCVVGLDRNWAYNPSCKAARP